MRSKRPFHGLHIWAFKVLTALRHFKTGLPTCIGIEAATGCNRRCHYCPQSKAPQKFALMEQELWDLCLYRLKEAGWHGMTSPTYYNEPSLVPGMEQRVRELAEIGTFPWLFTNGDNPEQIEAWIAAGARRIVITEHPPYKPEWEKAIYPIARRHPRVIDMKKLDQIIWRTSPISVNDETITTCRWSHGMSIRLDGTVSLCCIDYYHESSMGNVRDKPLWDIWNAPAYKAHREAAMRGRPTHAMCRKCLGV